MQSGSSIDQVDLQENGFVLDFLYQDARRVGSFLAQLDPSGHVQGRKATTSAGQAAGSSTAVSANANAVVARGGLNLSGHEDRTTSRSLEQTLDPLWTNAADLLNLLEDQGSLKRNIDEARIGDCIVLKGALGIFDLALLKMIWRTPELRTFLESTFAGGLMSVPDLASVVETFFPKYKSNLAQGSKGFAKMIMSILEMQADTLQGRLRNEDDRLFYFTLNEAGLVGSPTELFLKHGFGLAGEWSVMGIMDAVPGEATFQTSALGGIFGLSGNPLMTTLSALQDISRQAGRPEEAYGLSPLLIFRTAAA